MQNTLVKISTVLGVDSVWHVKFKLIFKILFICFTFASLNYLWYLQNGWNQSLFHILHGCTHACSRTGSCHGPGDSRVVSLVWPLLTSQSSTRRLVIDFYTPRFNEVERGVYWYHLVRLSVCGQNRVRSVSSTILIGSISYLHILSSNFRRCVACNARFKIQKSRNLSVSSAATAVYSSGWILSIFGTNDQ